MITFTQLGSYGRLGNQLFQYAALKATALRLGYECKIPSPRTRHWHGQECLLNNFNLECGELIPSDTINLYKIIEPHAGIGNYSTVLEQCPDKSDIVGFFQHPKYFEGFEEQIKKELTLKPAYTEYAQKQFAKFRRPGKELVSIHLRTGDVNDGTNPEYNKHYGTGPFDTNCTVGKYLTEAMSVFDGRDVTYFVFVGGSRSGDDQTDIQWARRHFSDKKFVVSTTNNPLLDFALITGCDHNITSPLSTYSWWAAYLNPNPNKVVTCLADYTLTGRQLPAGTYPSNWKVL